MVVIVLGCLKEALNMRRDSPQIHFIHSLVETLVACIVILVRQVSAWHAYKQLKIYRHKVEYVDKENGVKVRNRVIRKLLIIYSVVFALILIFNITAFLCCYFFAHLAWTILSNNFSLVTVMALDGPLRQRMQAEMALVSADHQKAVLYETDLLLNEAINAPEGAARQRVKKRVQKFQLALKDTDAFKQPDYITIPDGMNMLTTMEVVS